MVLLSEAREDTGYTVVSLYERDPKLLLFLHQAGIAPGGRVSVLKKNYDRTISIETDTGRTTMGIRPRKRFGLSESLEKHRRRFDLKWQGGWGNR